MFVRGATILLVTMVVAGCTTDLVTPASAQVEVIPEWELLRTPPISGRIWYSTVWTGQELVIWGGVLTNGTAMGDGAVFDRSNGQWRTMAASPLESRVGHTAVWTGDELIIWGGHKGA